MTITGADKANARTPEQNPPPRLTIWREAGCVHPNLIGIHSTALSAEQYEDWAGRGAGTIVWSPFSNVWLYGDTTVTGRLGQVSARAGAMSALANSAAATRDMPAAAADQDPQDEQVPPLTDARSGPSLVLGDIGTHAFHMAEFVSGLRAEQLSAELGSLLPDTAV